MATEDERDETQDRDTPPPARKPAERPPTVEELQDQLRAEREEKERVKAALKKTADEDLRKRRRLEELERAEEERKAASLSEEQKAARAREESDRKAAENERRAVEAERMLTEVRLERHVEAEARKAGFQNPELAFRLVDRGRIRFDDELERWEGVAEALKKLSADYPNLLAQRKAGHGSPPRDEHPGNPARPRNGAGQVPAPEEPADAFEAYVARRPAYSRL